MRVIRQINRGGFGIVHEIETGQLGRRARKTFDPLISDPAEREKLRRRFSREVRVQSQLRHPNIMPIVSFDLEASSPWFVMPLATTSFEQKLQSDRAQGIVDTAAWQDILGAVEELHRLGYVHRDLKPANVLCVDGRWVLADFGLILPIARDTTILTSSKSAYGSQFYAAPEQASDFRNTPEQADIFALGCMLHDFVEQNPVRVPFAQIRIAGLYGPFWKSVPSSKHDDVFRRLRRYAQHYSTFGVPHNSSLLRLKMRVFSTQLPTILLRSTRGDVLLDMSKV
jgi:serine/threonine protein kinase